MVKEKGTQNTHQAFTRGTQIFSHNVRMFIQGIKTAFWIALIFTVLWLLFRSLQKANFQDFYYWMCYGWAYIKFDILSVFFKPDEITLTYYSYSFQKWQYVTASAYLNEFWSSNHGRNITLLLKWFTSHALIELIVAFFIGIIASYWFFSIRGRKKMVKEKIRGNELLKSKTLAKKIRKDNQASDIEIAGLPLIKNSERYHILITGTTGSGKTNCLHELLQQIEDRGDKAVIFDLNNTFVGTYFNESRGDLLLNPFDARTVLWSPWADCKHPYDYDALADAFVHEESLSEKHWTSSAKNVFAEALRKTDSKLTSELIRILNVDTLQDYSSHFAGTLVASATDIKGGKSTASVRSTLSNCIHKLSYLEDTDAPFSIRRYVTSNDNNNWLFISTTPNQREALGTLLTSWLKVALNGIMERDQYQNNKNVWFIVDELPAIGKIPSLKTMVSEVRKYGGCLVAGMQDANQFFNDYGYYQSLNILNQFNTRLMFRANDKATAELSTQVIGEQEIQETKESLSYGSNTVRDGVNLNQTTHIKNLVLPSELMRMPDLSCYVKLQGDWPATKIKMKLHKVKVKVPAFIERKMA